MNDMKRIETWRGEARQGMTWRGKARLGLARRGEARRGMTRRDKTRIFSGGNSNERVGFSAWLSRAGCGMTGRGAAG